MFAIPISVLVLLAIVAVAVSPLLAMVAVGLLFAAFLAFAWSRPVARGMPTPGGVVGAQGDDRSLTWAQVRASHGEGRPRQGQAFAGEGLFEQSVRCVGRNRATRL